MKTNGSMVLGLGLAMLVVGRVHAAGLAGDAEAASHGDEAANLQVVEETKVDGADFTFRQYNLAVLSHYSYLLASRGEAILVDPARDIDRYLKDAKELGVTLKYVYLTHSHADFVAGHMEMLNAVPGLTIVINEDTRAGYKHTPAGEGFELRVGDIRGVVVKTPGHTPDGTCLYIHAPAASSGPRLVLTGDTLFIGSVGRPDLLGENMTAASLAAKAFESWVNKLSTLADDVKIFPAHGAGSLCGAHLSDKPVSTIGEQKKENPYVQHKDRNSFVMAMIEGLPEAPQYFGHNAAMNHDGPPLVNWTLKMPAPLAPQKVGELAEQGAWLVDVRDARPHAAFHPAKSMNIGIRGRFETWTGIMIPWGAPFVLIGSDKEVEEATRRLHRIGYDSPAGYLEGGLDAWVKAGLPVGSIVMVKPTELHKQMQEGSAPIIVDVRLPTEWMGLRIGEVMNIPINKLDPQAKKISRDMPVLTVCNSAYRSSMGAGVLQKMGFTDVRNMEGGSEAWIEAGLPTLGASKAGPAAPSASVYVDLPEPLVPEQLARKLMDLPGSFDIVDVRPPAGFAEYSIPGSVNVGVESLLNSPATLVDKRPLVIVCRDGFVSAAAGGVLARKTDRPIQVLVGGVAAYYDAVVRPQGIVTEKMTGASGTALPAPAPVVQPAAPASAPAAPAAPAPEAPKKKKSAGC